MSSLNKKRNDTLDFIKLLASFLVVFIHVPFYGIFGDIVKLFARVAVPIFFMTSGFFCYGKECATILRRTKKILVLFLFTSVLYNLTNIATAFLDGGINGIREYFSAFASIEGWVNLLIFNLPFSATRLWFLLALIYVYLLQMAVTKLKLPLNTLSIISAVLLGLHLVLGNGNLFFGAEIPEHYFRNFLLTGYPFFTAGMVMKQYEEKATNLNNKWLVITATAGTALTLIPLFTKANTQFSLGTLLLLFAIFTLSLKKSQIEYPAFILNLCTCSLGIYVFHRPVTVVVSKAIQFAGIGLDTVAYHTLLPVLVCIVTTIAVLIFKQIQKLLRFNII